MLSTNQVFSIFKHIFKSPGYGESLEKYIVSRRPQTPADVERLERQWYRNQPYNNHRGEWL